MKNPIIQFRLLSTIITFSTMLRVHTELLPAVLKKVHALKLFHNNNNNKIIDLLSNSILFIIQIMTLVQYRTSDQDVNKIFPTDIYQLRNRAVGSLTKLATSMPDLLMVRFINFNFNFIIYIYIYIF